MVHPVQFLTLSVNVFQALLTGKHCWIEKSEKQRKKEQQVYPKKKALPRGIH